RGNLDPRRPSDHAPRLRRTAAIPTPAGLRAAAPERAPQSHRVPRVHPRLSAALHRGLAGRLRAGDRGRPPPLEVADRYRRRQWPFRRSASVRKPVSLPTPARGGSWRKRRRTPASTRRRWPARAVHTQPEWTMTGRDYPTPAARVGRLVEAVEVVTKLLRGEVVTHHGPYLHVDDAFLLAPRPVQSTMPLLIGGGGAQVLRLGG